MDRLADDRRNFKDKGAIDEYESNTMIELAAAATIGLSPERLVRAHRFLDAAVAKDRIPGAALLVARGGTPVAPHAVGHLRPDSDAPIRPDTIFLTASVTKPVTVAATMLLVERGELLLDTPVAEVIPEFGVRGKDAVTVRHLMTHTSGLPDMLPDNEALRRRHAPFSEFIRRICELELDFAPGTRIQYQSCGIAILAEIVERIEGAPLRDVLRREFFEPLRMPDTSLGLQEDRIDRIAHVRVGEALDRLDWTWNRPYWQRFGAPWGGLFATVTDMWRFLQMFLNGGVLDGVRVLSSATVAMMTRDQTSPMVAIPEPLRAAGCWGLGWRIATSAEYGNFGDLLSLGSYGHGGATGTVVWADPVRELVCVLFTTEPSASSQGILGRCSNLVAAAAT